MMNRWLDGWLDGYMDEELSTELHINLDVEGKGIIDCAALLISVL